MHLPLLTIKMFYSSSLTSVLTTGRSWNASYGAEYPMAHCCVHMGNSPQFEKYDYFIHLSSSTEKFIMCYKLLNLQMLTNLNLKTSLWSRRYHYPHFKEKETKAWDDKELARDHSQKREVWDRNWGGRAPEDVLSPLITEILENSELCFRN